MQSVALINNTVNQMHHGCEVVVHQIERMLAVREISIVVSVMEGQYWGDSLEFMQCLPALDGIIVNGEGTIHHNRRAGRQLVEIAQLAKDCGVPCFLINTTYQGNSEDYRNYLTYFDRIYVRESESYKELKAIGVESKVVPDMTLSYDFRFFKNQLKRSRSGVGVTDSSMVAIAESLYGLSLRRGFLFLPVLRSYKENWKFIWTEFFRKKKFNLMLLLRRIFPSNSYLEIRNKYVKHTVTEYLNALAMFKGVVSGRFHSDCFCLLTGTPFLAIDGNSHKVSSMLNDIGLSSNRIILQKDLDLISEASVFEFSESELQAIEIYLDRAKLLINESFDEIAKTLTNYSVVKS